MIEVGAYVAFYHPVVFAASVDVPPDGYKAVHCTTSGTEAI